jgi:hypothetical protein
MVKRNAHCCGRVILLELAHCEIRVGHIPRRIHCVSPDRLLLRFFCQRVFSESPRTALRENLIALVNTSRDDANGRALGSSPAEKGGPPLYHKGTRNSPRAETAIELRRAFGALHRAPRRRAKWEAEHGAESAFPGVPLPNAVQRACTKPASTRSLPQEGNFPDRQLSAGPRPQAQPPAADSARAFDLFRGLTTISTRRLLARPSAVSFVATGRSSPRPCA